MNYECPLYNPDRLCYDERQAGSKNAVNKQYFRAQTCIIERMDEMAAAFFSEFLVELIKLVVLGVVAVAAIFCGKKLRDRKDAK